MELPVALTDIEGQPSAPAAGGREPVTSPAAASSTVPAARGLLQTVGRQLRSFGRTVLGAVLVLVLRRAGEKRRV